MSSYQPPTRRSGKSYVWTTWLAGLLGGKRCVWAVWFKAHYRYTKHEEMASDLVRWNREHTELMRRRKLEMEREGFAVVEENAAAFKIEGELAVLAGKPDLVGRKSDVALIVDGKTGRERESDVHQVLLYLYALPRQYPDLRLRALEGEVQYGKSGERVSVTPDALTPEYLGHMVETMRVIGSPTPPARTPDRDECRFCNIGPRDCPERVGALEPVAVGAAF